MFRVLWLDNDLAQTTPYVAALGRNGFGVTVVRTISECERQLEADTLESHYDLLILDVMIPTKDAVEENKYPPETTQRGTMTGLAVWKQWSARLSHNRTKTLVLTVRLDQSIKDQFLSFGLPRESFATKLDLHDTEAFVGRINRIIGIDRKVD